MLQPSVPARPGVEQVLEDPWVQRLAPNSKARLLDASALDNMKKFRSTNNLKKAALTVIAQQLTEDKITKLKVGCGADLEIVPRDVVMS